MSVLRRIIFGSPFAWSDYDRERIREIHAVVNENEDQADRLPRPLPSYPRATVLTYPPDVRLGIEREIAFRRYARRSGERVV